MTGEDFLYKVAPPRRDMLFEPTQFWRTADWESSSTRERDGYIKDEVLYAGDFDEINIHLFPRVRTARVRAVDANAADLAVLGVQCTPNRTAWIFVDNSRRAEVEAFEPTIYTFRPDGFTRVRNGEYISRRSQLAVAFETISMTDALRRWNVEACFVDDLDVFIAKLQHSQIYFEVQT